MYDQKESEIFLNCLTELLNYQRVAIEGLRVDDEGAHVMTFDQDAKKIPAVGRVVGGERSDTQNPMVIKLSMQLALREVQKLLADQDKPKIKSTIQTLIAQLRSDGYLLADPANIGSRNERIQGRQTKCVTMRLEALCSGVRPLTPGERNAAIRSRLQAAAARTTEGNAATQQT